MEKGKQELLDREYSTQGTLMWIVKDFGQLAIK